MMAFQNCNKLTDITISDKVTFIGYMVFNNCTSLTTMTVKATTPPSLADSDAIPNTIQTIYVPENSVDAYKSATNWSSFASKIKAIPS